MPDTITDLRETLELLLVPHLRCSHAPWSITTESDRGGAGVSVVFNEYPFGFGDDELIGTGDTESEALADAIATVRGWERA